MLFPFMRTKTAKAMATEAAEQAIQNASTIRDPNSLPGARNTTHNGNRNLDVNYGYNINPVYSDFKTMRDQNGFAKRVVDGPPSACWPKGIQLLKEEPCCDDDAQPELVEELATMRQQGLFRSLKKADKLNRIGVHSALYVGVGGDPDNEVKVSDKKPLETIFYSTFAEPDINIIAFDTDKKSPRFGQPIMYELTTHCENEGGNTIPFKAHWTRVVLLAEGSLTNDVCGESALRSLYNVFQDLVKVRGATAEAYFENCLRVFGLSWPEGTDIKWNDLYPDGSGDTNAEHVAKMMQDLSNKGRNAIFLTGGATITEMSTTVPNPLPAQDALLKEVSADSRTPIRELTGEGGGVLKGSEDRLAHEQVMQERKEDWCEGWLRAALEVPTRAAMLDDTKGLFVDWPVLKATDEETEAKVAKLNAETAEIEATTKSLGANDPGAMPPDNDEPADLTDEE